MVQPAWRAPVAGMLLVTAVFALGLVAGKLTGSLPGAGLQEQFQAAATTADTPVRITIPSLDVDARVHRVGLDGRGAIAAPPMTRADEAGWYAGGPSPGQDGAAIIVGHVDDEQGPAVFHGLAGLTPGARVEVVRHDGAIAVFEVTEVRTYPKERLPPDEVYGDSDRRDLRLITCGGEWVGDGTGYSDNVVVFATMVDADAVSRS